MATKKQLIVLERIKSIYDVSHISVVNSDLLVEYRIAGKDDTEFNVDKNGSVFDFYGLKKNFLSFGNKVHFFGDFCYDKTFGMIYVFDSDEIALIFKCPKRSNKHGYFCKCCLLNITAEIAPRILIFAKNICISPKKNHIVGFIQEDGKLMGYSWNNFKCLPTKNKLNQQYEFWYLDIKDKKSGRGAFIYNVSKRAFGSLKIAKYSMRVRKLPNCRVVKNEGKWLLEHKKAKGGTLLFPVNGGCYKSIRHAVSGAVRRKIKNYTVFEIGPNRYALHVV